MRVRLFPLGEWDRVGERGGRAGGRSEVKASEVGAREIKDEESFEASVVCCCC